MYICIYVDSLLVALIFKVGFFKARFFRRGWIVLVLGGFGPLIWGPREALGLQFWVLGRLWPSNLGSEESFGHPSLSFSDLGVFFCHFGRFWGVMLGVIWEPKP